MDGDLRLRPLRWDGRAAQPDDLADVQRVYEAFERSRIGVLDTSAADTQWYFESRELDRDETSLIVAGDDEVVGVVYLKASRHRHDVYGDVAALPGPREREVLALAVDHVVAASRRIAAALGEPGWTLRINCWSSDEVLPTLFQAHGLQPVRRFFRMRIESSSPEIPAVAPDLPPGVEIVVRDDDETHRAIWAVDNESFLDHWNFAPTPYEDWWEEFGTGASRDPDGWWLLTVDGEPAAICLLDERRADMDEGYVGVLGVRRQFRRRGLAALLLQRAFVHYRDLGRTATLLSVDAESLTGAVGVYERVGMHPEHVVHGWALPLS